MVRGVARMQLKLTIIWVLFMQIPLVIRSDFLSSCPSHCKCGWSGGKMKADCSNNGLNMVPSGFRTDVQVLNMDGNTIRFLTKETMRSGSLNELHEVSLRGCKIQKVSEEAFSNLLLLTYINLANNNLTKLPTEMFSSNDKLRILILSGNQISMLVAYQFPPLVSLKKIDLSNNGLRFIDRKAFMNLGTSVEMVDLRGNFLRSVGRETFFPLHQLKDSTLLSQLAHEVMIILGVTGGSVVLVTVLIIIRMFLFRKPSESAHLNLCSSTSPAYKDPARESLLHYSGSISRSLGRPNQGDQERKSIRNPSTQPGIIRRSFYSSHPDQYPDQYPDLLNIYNSYPQPSDASCFSHPQPLDPVHLISPVQTNNHTPPVTRHTPMHQTTCCNSSYQPLRQEPAPPAWQDYTDTTQHAQHLIQSCQLDEDSSRPPEVILLPPSPFSPTNLATIYESDIHPQRRTQPKKCPPPTLPKPVRSTAQHKYNASF